jgi:hypothetical protein
LSLFNATNPCRSGHASLQDGGILKYLQQAGMLESRRWVRTAHFSHTSTHKPMRLACFFPHDIFRLQACDFFADENGVESVGRELGCRLFSHPEEKNAQQIDGDSDSISLSGSLVSESSIYINKAKQGGPGAFWASAWKTTWSPRAPLDQCRQYSVPSAFKVCHRNTSETWFNPFCGYTHRQWSRL